jgi:hypothetical protein
MDKRCGPHLTQKPVERLTMYHLKRYIRKAEQQACPVTWVLAAFSDGLILPRGGESSDRAEPSAVDE